MYRIGVIFFAFTSLVLLTWPLLIFAALQSEHVEFLLATLLILLCSHLVFLFLTKKPIQQKLGAALGVICLLGSFLLQDQSLLLFYPVLMNLALLLIFSQSLFYPPSIITRLARLQTPNLSERAVRYTVTVTKVWCLFFLINGLLALLSIYYQQGQYWIWYNGFISYGLIALIFGVEYCIRQKVKEADRVSINSH